MLRKRMGGAIPHLPHMPSLQQLDLRPIQLDGQLGVTQSRCLTEIEIWSPENCTVVGLSDYPVLLHMFQRILYCVFRNKYVNAVTLLTCLREVTKNRLGHNYSHSGASWFSSAPVNAGHDRLLSIHYPSVIQSFYATGIECYWQHRLINRKWVKYISQLCHDKYITEQQKDSSYTL